MTLFGHKYRNPFTDEVKVFAEDPGHPWRHVFKNDPMVPVADEEDEVDSDDDAVGAVETMIVDMVADALSDTSSLDSGFDGGGGDFGGGGSSGEW